MKPVRLIKMCLNETHNKVYVGKPLSDVFPVLNGLKWVNAVLQLLFSFALENTIKKVKGNEETLHLNRTHELLFMLMMLLYHVKTYTIKNNTEVLLDTSKEVGPEISAENIKCLFMFHHQNAGQNDNINSLSP
jgi:hypothetical protein